MPLLKKLISIGDSRALIIPFDYLEYYRKQGKIIKQVGLEVNKNLVIKPIFEDVKNGGDVDGS